MALQIVEVTNSIGALQVSGVRILDLDEIPSSGVLRAPVLFPEPLGFITDFELERNSFGGGSVALQTARYNLNYTFLFAPIGAGRTGLDVYDEMVTKAAAILDAVIAINTFSGGVDIVPLSPLEFGPVPDPAGNQFLGCRFVFRVTEFVN